MFLRRRRRQTARRLVALLAAMVVQVWSLAPVAASVIYCIGEDGHSGFELVKAGARGCAACCHNPLSGEDGAAHAQGPLATGSFASGAIGEPVSECTDIALAPASGVVSKISAMGVVATTPVAVAFVDDAARRRPATRRTDIDQARGSPRRLLRHTVLLI